MFEIIFDTACLFRVYYCIQKLNKFFKIKEDKYGKKNKHWNNIARRHKK